MGISNRFIMSSLDNYVFGHMEAKKALITMINRARLRHHQKFIKEMDEEYLIAPMKVLLIAPSGTGKTHLVESLRKVVPFPLIRVDATQMNPAGSSGGVKMESLKKYIVEEATRCCLDYPEHYFSIEGAVDRAVVFIDEVDKLGTSFESSGNWNQHVQSNFLTLFDNKQEFAGVSFVFAGAFSEITKMVHNKNSIGFMQGENINKTEDIDEKLMKSGLIPELVGRINYIAELDLFNEDDLLKIMQSKILPKKLRDLAAYGLFNVEITEDRLREIAHSGMKSGQGVRYLQRALDKLFLEFEYETDLDPITYNSY